MPNLMMSVSHQLSQDEALRRIRAMVAHAKVQYSDKINDLRDSWKGNVGTFNVSGMGQKASGTVAVNPSDVTVQIRLPFAASLFKSKIESGIRDTLSRILA
jgi:Putative polyhydroxyalkanoic acid system protein (PHA_gran_rgn)